MNYEKQERKDFFESKILGLIIHTLYTDKEIRFFINLKDLDEVVLRKDINFFRQSFRHCLENFLNLSGKLFNILPKYLAEVKLISSENENLSPEIIDTQLEKLKSLRKTLDRTDKYLTAWVRESESYYADKIKTTSFEGECIDNVFDLTSNKFFFINPLRIQTSFPPNLSKLDEVFNFAREIWKSHFEFYHPEEGDTLDTELPEQRSRAEVRFHQLQNR